MMLAQKLLETAGNGVLPTYIEDVFSTYLYTSTGSNQTIVNGINLATNGGLVWVKGRNAVKDNVLVDTARGVSNSIVSNTTNGQDYSSGNYVNAFNSDGFGVGGIGAVGGTNNTFASWTFRKQPKFFDVQTATTNGSSNYGSTVPSMTIAHNLGSIPGCVIVKRTDGTGGFYTWHRGLASTLYYVSLNTTSASAPYGGNVNGTGGWIQATSTHIYLDAWFNTYEPGNYVVYIFAHDAGGFGLTGADNVISCGSYTGDGSISTKTVTLGYEPQWLLIKRTDSSGNWHVFDNMRGISAGGNDPVLLPDQSGAELTSYDYFGHLTATGFNLTGLLNVNGGTYMYVAIRRGPMRAPTSGTSVYSPQVQTPSGSDGYVMAASSGFPVDFIITKQRTNSSAPHYTTSRLTNNYLSTGTTDVEGVYTYGFDRMQGVSANWNSNNTVSHAFRRAPKFFDMVCYTGDGTSNRSISHNLGAVPELFIVKRRNSGGSGDVNWGVYSQSVPSIDNSLILNSDTGWYNAGTGGWFGTGTLSDTLFPAGRASGGFGNLSGGTYVAHLFASCPGVSKVGSFTNTGSTLNIDCGFTGGARFVLLKRTSTSGGWFVYDTARGINAGTDPGLALNSTAVEYNITDDIDAYAPGFTFNGANWVNADYIYLAIA